jgi:hypothetical protein
MSAKKTRKTPEAIREGSWLVAAMQKANTKNTLLVERLGLNTENLVSQWRTGTCPMTDLQMLQVSKILDVDAYPIRPRLSLYAEALEDRHLLTGLTNEQLADVVKYVGLVRGTKTSGEASVKPKASKARPKSARTHDKN